MAWPLRGPSALYYVNSKSKRKQYDMNKPDNVFEPGPGGGAGCLLAILFILVVIAAMSL